MQCPVCHFGNFPGDDMCANCGADLWAVDVPEPATGFHGKLLGAHLDELGAPAPQTVPAGTDVETALVSWSEPETVVDRAPWDLVLGADLLYEQRNVDQLLSLLPRLGGEILIAEPGRPAAGRFFEEIGLAVTPLAKRLYRLTGPAP